MKIDYDLDNAKFEQKHAQTWYNWAKKKQVVLSNLDYDYGIDMARIYYANARAIMGIANADQYYA